MKTIKMILNIAFALVSLNAFSQESGVYMSASDFASGKLTYAINCSTEKHKIKLNEFLNRSYITVVHNGESHNLTKKEIFGYKDCDGVAYRFINDGHFVILNPSEEILIYKHTKGASKNQQAVTHYYFSLGGSDTVARLTLENLKKLFPENHKFHDALDAAFKSDDELAAYDSFHKMYKVTHIYVSSK
jgi:hypothetical protein